MKDVTQTYTVLKRLLVSCLCIKKMYSILEVHVEADATCRPDINASTKSLLCSGERVPRSKGNTVST